jgi:hypothetical protein
LKAHNKQGGLLWNFSKNRILIEELLKLITNRLLETSLFITTPYEQILQNSYGKISTGEKHKNIKENEKISESLS